MTHLTDRETALRLTQELLADLGRLSGTVSLMRRAYGHMKHVKAKARQRAVEFGRKLSLRNQHLHDYYVSANQEFKLKLFSIHTVGFSPMQYYDMTVATFRRELEREQALLRREIAEVKASAGGRPDLPAHGIPDLGQALRSARVRRGHSQEEAASQIGCATSTISRIERGQQSPRKWKGAIQPYIEGE